MLKVFQTWYGLRFLSQKCKTYQWIPYVLHVYLNFVNIKNVHKSITDMPSIKEKSSDNG